MRRQDVDRLAADRAGRAEEGDAASRAVAAGVSVSGPRRGHRASRPGAANRNESTRSRIPPWPGMSVPESFAPGGPLEHRLGEVAGLGRERRGAARGRAPISGGSPSPTAISADDDRAARRGRRRAPRTSSTARCGSGTCAARSACRRSRRRCRRPRRRGRAAGSSRARAPSAASGAPAGGVRRRVRRAGRRTRGATT